MNSEGSYYVSQAHDEMSKILEAIDSGASVEEVRQMVAAYQARLGNIIQEQAAVFGLGS